MAKVKELQAGSTRRLPIQQTLKDLLEAAATAAGVEEVQVTSGGQPAYPGQPRKGGTRHDNGRAADLKLVVGGKRLRFTDSKADPRVEAFVEAAAALGAIGIGAGLDYMGPETLHIGYGLSLQDTTEHVWGQHGHAANAPQWLRQAAMAGWAKRGKKAKAATVGVASASVGLTPPASYTVIARDGLRLRGGPGLDFERLALIKAGTELVVIDFAGSGKQWAKVDLNGDGLVDGYVFAEFLAPAGDEADRAPKA